MTAPLEAGPLEGVRVVELGGARPAQFAAAILADLGADVVTVLFGPDTGEPASSFDRNKQRLFLEPIPSGDHLSELVDWAEIVLDGVTGTGAPATSMVAEALGTSDAIVCETPAFGGLAPAGVDPRTRELLIEAVSGCLDLTGDPNGPPTRMGIDACDLATGMYLAIGAMAAARSSSPRDNAARVEVAGLDVAIALLSNMSAAYFVTGKSPRRLGTGHATIFPYNAFATADGEIVVAPFTQRFWKSFCRAIDRPDLLDVADYRNFLDRSRTKEQLRLVLIPELTKRTTDDWVAQFEKFDVPCGPVLSLPETLEHPQTRHRGVVRSPDPGEAPPDAPRMLASPASFQYADGTFYRAPLRPVATTSLEEIR